MSLFKGFGDWFRDLWISLWLVIDNMIYQCINWVYRIFILVAKVDIFGGGDQIEMITRRLYIIVGIAMLFIFAYNLILLIVNPDGKQIGDMGKVVKNAIISVILVTLLPLIFSYLTTIQAHVLDSNVIGQIILGTSGDDTTNSNKKAGASAAIDIFSAFYHPEGQSFYSCEADEDAHELCPHYVETVKKAKQTAYLPSFIWDVELKDATKDGDMEYNWIISTIAGCFALWMFISFSLDIGVRVGKLAFYELVSPIPVMMRILPGDKMFDKWFKGIKDTYLSLFVRLAIIYFCMYAITLVPGILGEMFSASGDSAIIVTLANVVVILGILMFAKEAPKLISDLFGGSGSVKFGIGSKIRDNKFGMAGMGALGAGFGAMAGNAWNSFKHNKGLGKVSGAITSGIGGFVGGARRGVVSGYKSDSFKGLGKGITQAKMDAAAAREKHKATREHGEQITGLDIPVVGGLVNSVVGAGANIGTGIKTAWGSASNWITDENASAHRGKAINDFKSKVSSFKDGSYYNRGTYSSTQRDAWLEEIRKGGKVTIGTETYSVDGTKYKDYKSVEDAVKSAIDRHNKTKNIEAYKSNADLVAGDLSAMLKSLMDNQPAFGKVTEQALAKELRSALDKVGNRSNTELQKLMTGDNINWGEVNKLLSMKETQIQSSSVDTRAALYEFTQAAEKGMKRADALNRQMKEKE